MQDNSDLSSRRAGSEVFPTANVFPPVETNDSVKAAPVALFTAVSLRLIEWLEVSDADGLVAEDGCSTVKTWPSNP